MCYLLLPKKKKIYVCEFQSHMCFIDGSDSKEIACNVGDLGLTPGLGRYPGKGNGYPLQYSCLENSMERGAWQLQSMGSQGAGHN